MKSWQKAVIGLAVVLALGIAVYSYMGEPEATPEPPEDHDGEEGPEQEDKILDPAHWEDEYPEIYQSYMRNTPDDDDNVKRGSDQQVDYIERYPQIETIYEGFGFAKEYFSTVGHLYSLTSVREIARPKPGANCLACKTADYEGFHEEYGDDLFAMEFNEMAERAQWNITCYSCHGNNPGEAYISVPQAEPGFAQVDFDIPDGTASCAQCHVEYYFDEDTMAVVFPWENGLTVDDMEEYFDEREFADWEHPRTGTPLIKIQHPEFEMYTGSPHDQLGMSCADCHMPTVESEEGVEYVSHWWSSPLHTAEESCLGCHADHDAESINEWVSEGQAEVEEKQVQAMDTLVELIEELAARVDNDDLDDEVLEEVRSLHRQAQIRWDFVFAENSTGSHYFDRAHEYLDESIEIAEEALRILEEN
ncbi:ammonia-forming cytochrome c nitrite reductase subunit c552 [Proteinivorax tanatarense]|uniref:nitrite reductase (cytochrome; ammonia-forming) n=1 Tax=Proteinivorax tanatarense TaxID=1260629 RepID=A0AAU7VNF0_9FIRM